MPGDGPSEGAKITDSPWGKGGPAAFRWFQAIWEGAAREPPTPSPLHIVAPKKWINLIQFRPESGIFIPVKEELQYCYFTVK